MSALSGKIALVTGSGLGIGQEIALELARQGATVGVHYSHSASGAKETMAEIERLGGKALLVQADLSRIQECRKLVNEVADAFGGLDILVNNAGVTRADRFINITEDVYNEVFHLNIQGYFFCAQEAVRSMLKRGGGSIVNITSVHGYAGFPRHSVYAATKGAINAFTRELAIELAPDHIRVNAVGPGLIEVPRYQNLAGYTREFGGTLVPWGRAGLPKDIAPTVAFLVSEASDFITGQVLYVDGGTTARLGLWWDQGDEPQ